MEQDSTQLGRQDPSWHQTRRGLIRRVVGGMAALAIMWLVLWIYIDPDKPGTTERKDLVIAFAAVAAGIGGVGTLYVGWKNMITTQKTLSTNQESLRIAQENTTRTLENTRKVEEERAREQALRSYLDTIGELLAEEKLQLPHHEPPGDDKNNGKTVVEGARTVARAQTLTVLQALDGDRKRKRILVQFLYEAHLIIRSEPVISLIGADLRGADLKETYLRGADLYKTDLRGADLWMADLRGATVCEADLRGAYLQEADLGGTDLGGADLSEANDLTKEQVEAAHINQETKLPPELQHLSLHLSVSDQQH
jgi:hypothetical protein